MQSHTPFQLGPGRHSIRTGGNAGGAGRTRRSAVGGTFAELSSTIMRGPARAPGVSPLQRRGRKFAHSIGSPPVQAKSTRYVASRTGSGCFERTIPLDIRVARGEAEVSWGGGSIPRRGRVRVPPWWETPVDIFGLPATLDTVTRAESSRYCATASPEGSENSSYFHVAENVTRRF